MSLRLLVLAAVLASGSADADAAPALPAYADFKDWTVACDVVGDCEARGYDAYGEAGLWLRLVRAAGAGAPARLEIHGLSGTREPAGFLFDGRRVARDAGWTMRDDREAGPAAYVMETSDLAAIRRFVAQARSATRVTVAGQAQHGSLAGFNAAMLHLDDVQGRVGGPDAIAAAGDLRIDVPGPRPLPVVHARPWRGAQPDEAEARRYLQALPGLFGDCDEADAREGELVAISAREVLALVLCWRGAYQEGHLVLRGPRRDPRAARPVELPAPPREGRGATRAVVSNAGYDPATASLSGYAKGRGLFDCGESTRWVFDGERFQLADHALLERCGWMAPADFPVLWRSRVVTEPAR